MLQNYGQRLVRLAEETESAMRELRDLRRGRVLIGANEAAVHTLLPLIARFRQRYPDIAIDVRRVPARQIAVEVQQGSLDFGALTFHPPRKGCSRCRSAATSSCCSCRRRIALADRRQVTMEDIAAEPVVAHNDPSPARERVLRLFEEHHIPLQHGDFAAEPRRHQARGRAEARRRAAAAPLRDHRDRQRPARRRSGHRHLAQASGDARLPQGAPLARGGRVPGGRAGKARIDVRRRRPRSIRLPSADSSPLVRIR